MSFLTERLFQILDRHCLYEKVTSEEGLRYFMERHVICAWSYATLLHALHRDLVSMSSPIKSEGHKEILRLITEIVLNEEVQDIGNGRLISQMELYLEAMHDVNCDLAPVLSFFDVIENGASLEQALEQAKFAKESQRYGRFIMGILDEPAHIKAAALFYEGEPYIPNFFLQNLYHMGDALPVEHFLDYFENHIEGLKQPGFSASGRIVEILCKDDIVLLDDAEKIAEKLMGQRIELWNSIARGLDRLPGTLRLSPLRQTRHLRLVT